MAMLGYLALREQRLMREVLAQTFWPDASPNVARGNLRVVLSSLRGAAPGLVAVRRDTVEISPEVDLSVDALELRRSFDIASDDSLSSRDRIGAARRAVAAYSGDLLPGFDSIDAPAFRIWLDAEREALRHCAVRTAALLVDLLLDEQRHDEASSEALRLIALDEYREASYGAAMRAMSAAGEPQRALAQYERARAALVDDLGVDLGPDTIALASALRAGLQPSIARRPVLGRVAGLPLRTHVVGRDGLIDHIVESVRADGERVVTLIGPAGVGKTTLGVAAAHRWREDGYDVVYVDVSPIVDPAQLPRAIEVAFGGGYESEGGDVDALADYIGARSVRIVLDNLEQLPGAAPIVHRLSARCPSAFILATSRLPLGLGGERMITIPPLGLPGDDEPETISSAAAVEMFRHCALVSGAAPSDDIDELRSVARICRLLDGLPLAIELAASRSRFMTAAALATMLERDLSHGSYSSIDDDVDRRDQGRRPGLRAALSSSVALLDPPARRCFEGASVFEGAFLADDLVALTECSVDDDTDRSDVVRSLGVLSDLHLLRREHVGDLTWFLMLPTVRALATSLLSAGGRADSVLARRVEHDCGLIEAAADATSSPSGRDWFIRLDRYGATLRSTLDQLQSAGDARTFRIVTDLAPYWFDRGLVAEALRRLVAARTTIDATTPAWLVAMNRLWVVLMGAEALGYSTVSDAADEAVVALGVVRAESPSPRTELLAMHVARHVFDISGRPDLARELVEEGLRLSDDTGHAWERVEFRYAGVVLDHLDGDDARARRELTRVCSEAELLGHRRMVLYSRMLMDQYGLTGPAGGTAPALAELLDLAVELGDRRQVVWLTASLAAMTAFGGELPRGAALTLDALSISRDADYFLGLGLSLMCATAIAVIDERPELAARFHHAVEPDLGPISRAIPRGYVDLYLSVVDLIGADAAAEHRDGPPGLTTRSATLSAAATYLATVRDRAD